MVAIWGTNFSLVKVALRDFPELAFNAFRLVIASTIFLGALWWQQSRAAADGTAPRPALTRTDWARLVFLGVVGHFLYQFLFLGGVKRTSVGNGSLILGTTPVVVALLTSLAGHERVPPLKWLGAAISFIGLYIVVGQKVDWSASGHLGDLLVFASTVCSGHVLGGVGPAAQDPLAARGDRLFDLDWCSALHGGFAADAAAGGLGRHFAPELVVDDGLGGVRARLRVSHLVHERAARRQHPHGRMEQRDTSGRHVHRGRSGSANRLPSIR